MTSHLPAATEAGEIKDLVMPALLGDLSQPVVLRGLVAHWPAVIAAKQSNEVLQQYLAGFSSELPLVVYESDPEKNGNKTDGSIGYRDDFAGFTFDRCSSTLMETIARLLQKPRQTLYIGSTRVDKWLPGFRADNDVVFNGCRPVINFWLGNQNKVSAHYDSPNNLACCVAGKRTFTLFPPEQIDNLYIGPVDLTPSGRAISLVDCENPNFERFPKFRQALDAAQKITLDPGDALYIPPLWWHHVQSHCSVNMLVNYWWKNAAEYRGIPDLALEHAILALRGLPEADRKAWKSLFDYYVFDAPEKALEHIPAELQGMLDPDNERAAQQGWFNFGKKMNS